MVPNQTLDRPLNEGLISRIGLEGAVLGIDRVVADTVNDYIREIGSMREKPAYASVLMDRIEELFQYLHTQEIKLGSEGLFDGIRYFVKSSVPLPENLQNYKNVA